MLPYIVHTERQLVYNQYILYIQHFTLSTQYSIHNQQCNDNNNHDQTPLMMFGCKLLAEPMLYGVA